MVSEGAGMVSISVAFEALQTPVTVGLSAIPGNASG